MSNFSSPGLPPGYGQQNYGNFPAGPPQRPVVVTVLGIIGLIVGGLSLICVPVSLLPLLTPLGEELPDIQEIKASPFLYNWSIISAIIGTINALVLLVGSVGSLLLRQWGRKLLLLYAVIALVMGIAGTAITLPRMLKKMADQGAAFAAGGAVGGACGLIIALLLPIFILIFMLRPDIKAAFAGSSGGLR